MRSYKTLGKEVHLEEVIEKSRFIAHGKPVADREEAEAFLRELRERYKDATHNVPAMVLGAGMEHQWTSDDGEPQGTSGPPILQLLVKEEITNVILVVTRYFGGVKLGTGGLVRAYTGVAQAAIREAGIREVRERVRLRAAVDYAFLGALEYALEEKGYRLESKDFAEAVRLSVTGNREEETALRELLSEGTKGRAIIEEAEYFMG